LYLNYYLVLSRLEPYKKINLAIEACRKLNQKLIIIGEGSQIRELKRKANNDKKIIFLGWKKDNEVHNYLANAKALIFPGEEDFGITPIEIMAAGRPVIAYRKGGVSESVIEGKTGIFFDEPTSESLVKAIEEFERTESKFLSNDCAQQAKKFSKKRFINEISQAVNKGYQNYQNRL
jgi:glycosyltransferase involved in cell wall biosynthesis